MKIVIFVRIETWEPTFTNPQQSLGVSHFRRHEMTATLDALYSQNSSQTGTTVAGAFPQTNPTGLGPQNLDLLQVVTKKGGAALLKVDYAGNVVSGAQSGLAITSVSVSSFAISAIAFSGGINTITGTFTGASSAWVGLNIAILGATTSANNGTYVIISANTTTITVANAAGVTEAETATGSVYGVSTATYHGTFSNVPSAGTAISVAGFTNATNNVTSDAIASATGSTIVVSFAGQIAETASATASISVSITNGFRIIQQASNFGIADNPSVAQVFTDAFANPSSQDILQVINAGGNIHYYLDHLGVAHGS